MTENEITQHKQICDEVRKQLREGPWMTEPDRLNWQHAGLDCMIVRVPYTFALCGYVGLPPGHRYYGKDYNSCDVEVWGGLTYGNYCQGHVCHVTAEEEKTYWLGFDCAHFGDFCPGMAQYSFGEGVYRDISFVKAEVDQLAEQLARPGV